MSKWQLFWGIYIYWFISFWKIQKSKSPDEKNLSPLYMYISMYSTQLPKVHLLIFIVFLNHWIGLSNIWYFFFEPYMIPKPSYMNLKKSFGHFNFQSFAHFFFSSSCNMAKYKSAKIGAKTILFIISIASFTGMFV